ILHAVNALDLDHVNELENFADIDYINEKIATTQFIEKLFESNRIHTGFSSVFTNTQTLNSLATALNNAFDQIMDVTVNITGSQLRIDGDEYGIFTVNQNGTPVVKVSEIKQFILSATATNWLELDLPTNIDGIADFVEILLEEDTEGTALIDEVFSSKILMAVIDRAATIAAPVVVDKYVTDVDLSTLLNDALMSDPNSGVVDLDFIQEIDNLLIVLKSVYHFTTISELMELPEADIDGILQFVADFASMTGAQFTQLSDAVGNLQIVSRAGHSLLTYVKNLTDIEQLYVPTTVDLGKDLTSILRLVYTVGGYLADNIQTGGTYEDFDMAPLFADETFKSYLLDTPAENHSELLLINIAHLLQYYSEDEDLGKFLSLPADLTTLDPESTLWRAEINTLFGGVFDLIASFEDSPYITLSLNGIKEIAEDPMQLNIRLVAPFANMAHTQEVFGGIDSSRIFRTSVFGAINEFGKATSDLIAGYELKTPATASLNGTMLNPGALVDMVYALANVVDDVYAFLNADKFADFADITDMVKYLEAFNKISNNTIFALDNSDLIRGFLGDALLSSDVQAFARGMIDDMNLGFTLSEEFLSLSRPNDRLARNEISDMLFAARALDLTRDVLENPSAEIFPYLRTFTDARLDIVLGSKLIKEIITFAVNDSGLIEFAADMAEEEVNKILASFEEEFPEIADLNINYVEILEQIGTFTGSDGLFAIGELKNILHAVNALDLDHVNELENFADIDYINEKIATTQFIEKLFESNRIHTG
ncbi:MAG: hypothetical protein IH571_06045, partial [Acholeplasmataceae bacterium]|nr:hypothetical protein [Acholeplasmataceae bacterium]